MSNRPLIICIIYSLNHKTSENVSMLLFFKAMVQIKHTVKTKNISFFILLMTMLIFICLAYNVNIMTRL